jgi:hypothetical protein
MPRPDIRIMERNNHNQNNGNGSGFLLGVIVGVILTLLFTTKKGREILKEVLEKGVEKFANLEDLMEKTYKEKIVDDDEDESGDDFVPTEPIREVETPKVKKVVEVKIEPAKTQPPKEPTPTKPVKEELPEEKEDVPEDKPEVKAPEKPKPTTGKRWFRGLRKKN